MRKEGVSLGYKTEFNWVLKLKPEQGLDEKALKEGMELKFRKDGQRIYPVGFPICLANKDWELLALVVVTSFTVNEKETTGTCRVISLPSDSERKAFAEDLRRKAVYLKKDSKDISKVKLT